MPDPKWGSSSEVDKKGARGGGKSHILALLFLGSLAFVSIVVITSAIPAFNLANNSPVASRFPCWAMDPIPMASADVSTVPVRYSSGVFKCGAEDGQLPRHTITAREELCMADHPAYNSPWFYAPLKLSLCWIPKAGCTKTKEAFAYLTGVINETDIHAHSPLPLRIDNLSIDDLNYVFSADDWLNIVVVRDPLERFISGYVDKVWNSRWFNAERRNYNLTGQSVRRFLSNDRAMHSDHFAPQSEYCGLRQLGSAWNRLIIHSRIGMEAKLSEASDGRLDSVLYGQGDLPSSRPVFSSGTKHETQASSEYQTLMKELCCTDVGNSALQEIAAFFKEDYERFPFPTSDWRQTEGICNTVECAEHRG